MSSYQKKKTNRAGEPYYAQSEVWQQSDAGQFRPFPADARSTFPPPPLQQRPPGQPLHIPPMPKAQALERVETFKRWIVVAAILSFGVLSSLVLGNMPKSVANQTTPASSSNTSSSSNSGSGGFFQQQGGGYGFGSSGSNQGAVSSSSGS